MKKLFKTIFALLFFVSIVLQPYSLDTSDKISLQKNLTYAISASNGTSQAAASQGLTPGGQQAKSNLVTESALTIDCKGIDLGCHVGNGLLWIFNLIWFQLTQVLAFVAGFTLDVLLFHSISSGTYRTGLIEAGWEILRNLTNIIFIFSLMVIAFKMVLGGAASIKKTLLKTIMVALVINFSLFVTYVIMDTSNIMANIFYSRIGVENESTNTNGLLNSFFSQQSMKSPSAAIVSKFEPQSIVTKAGDKIGFLERFLVVFASGGINILMISIFLGIILLFLGRTVGLMLAAILSPIAFATLTVPTQDLSNLPWVGFNSWLKQLISLSFMAPVYLFFLYLIIMFADNNALFNSISIAGNTGEGAANVLNLILGVLIPFAIIAMLLYTAKKITTSMAGEIGSRIAGFASKGLTGAAVVASGGIAATAAIGGGLSRATGYIAKKAGNEAFGEKASRFGKGLQTTSFDVSKIPGFSKTFSSSFASKAAKGIGGGVSYAEANVSARKGINTLKSNIPFTKENKAKGDEKINEWDSAVQKIKDGDIKNQLSRAERDGLKTNNPRTGSSYEDSLEAAETLYSKGQVTKTGATETVAYNIGGTTVNMDMQDASGANVSRIDYETKYMKRAEKEEKRYEEAVKNARASGTGLAAAQTALRNHQKNKEDFEKGTLKKGKEDAQKDIEKLKSQIAEKVASKIEGKDPKTAQRVRSGKITSSEGKKKDK